MRRLPRSKNRGGTHTMGKKEVAIMPPWPAHAYILDVYFYTKLLKNNIYIYIYVYLCIYIYIYMSILAVRGSRTKSNYFFERILLRHTADMSAVSHTRHVCCVALGMDFQCCSVIVRSRGFVFIKRETPLWAPLGPLWAPLGPFGPPLGPWT